MVLVEGVSNYKDRIPSSGNVSYSTNFIFIFYVPLFVRPSYAVSIVYFISFTE